MRWVSSHSGLLLQADALKLRSEQQKEDPYACYCRICDAPVGREQLEHVGSRGIEVRVWCETPYHKGTGAKTEQAIGIERESDTETDADLMRHVASYPWFHQGEMPITARKFYDPDSGAKPE